jgi:glycosyltransferase involved in cell wall biosynthesis
VTQFAPQAAIGDQPLRIVHVLRAPVGGLFRHVLDLTRAQIARGHLVGLIADSTTGGARGEQLLADIRPSLALGLTRYPMQRMPHLSDLAALLTVWRKLKALRPDVAHGHGSKGGFYARLCAPSGAVRAYTPHGGSLNYQPGTRTHRLFMAMEGVLARCTDLHLFESGYIEERYRTFVGAPCGLSRIVRNGVADSEFEPIAANADAADFVYVGEFRAAKGLDTLLEALARIAQRTGQRPRVALVGDGPSKAALRDDAQRLGVEAQLTVHSPMPARVAFALGRVMLVPSRAESLPYIVLEAAAARLPLIATNVGGVAEIFGPFANRLIASDNVDILSAAMLEALADTPEQRAEKAATLAAYVHENFSLTKMVDDVLGGYREALTRRRGA